MAVAGKKTLDMVYIAMGAVMITICSWISIPTSVPFTMQTFAVFLVTGLLGGRRGTLSVIVYILLGVIGIPVYAGFTSGLGIVLGETGGYMVGFIGTALLMWLIERFLGNKSAVLVSSMVLGLLLCYVLGTFWFMQVYARNIGGISLATALGWCVAPFVIPDLVKIGLAAVLTRRLGRYVS